MKTAQTERGHIAEAFTRVALANPHVQMTLMNNGKVQHQLAASDSWAQRIAQFFGPEIGENLIPVSNEDDQVSISGFVVNPSVNRSNNRMQYLFLNDRFIRDRSLQHALSEAYRGLLMVGRYPICFLRMHMQGQLSRRNPVPESEGDNLELKPAPSENQERIAFGPTVVARDWTSTPRQPGSGLLPGQSANFRPFPPLNPATDASVTDLGDSKVTRALPPGYDPFSQPMPDPFSGAAEQTANQSAGESVPHEDPFSSVAAQAPTAPKAPLAIQVHNTYLVHETEDGMIITDQHALHERIIYEQIREKVLAGTLEKQHMLVPEPVALRPAEAAAVLEQADLLKGLGIEVEPFGGDTVLVASYPAMLSNQNPAEVLKGVIEKLMGEAKNLDQRDLVDELLHMISCKAAIKAGDKLTPEEIEALLEQRELCQDGHHCPHGRPTSLTFSREELDKKFKRI